MTPTDDILSMLMEKGSVTLKGELKSLQSLYIMLFRKFKAECETLDSMGYLPTKYENSTLGVSYKVDQATFTIKKRKQRPSYEIVSTDLEQDQSCEIRNGSSGAHAQQQSSDHHPSYSQGEDDGYCLDAQARGTDAGAVDYA